MVLPMKATVTSSHSRTTLASIPLLTEPVLLNLVVKLMTSSEPV